MNKSEQNKKQAAQQALPKQSVKGQAIVVGNTTEKPVANRADQKPREVNGPRGLEPTRYGDWEANGRCYDF